MKTQDDAGASKIREQEFEESFSRCRGSLQLIAEMVLDGAEGAEEAMKRCYAAVAGRRDPFASEGEFRSWVMRELLNEALMILRERQSEAEGNAVQVLE